MFARSEAPSHVVASVRAVSFRPSDVVVITMSADAPHEEYPRIAEMLTREYPDQKFLILESGMTLEQVDRSVLAELIAPKESADVRSQ